MCCTVLLYTRVLLVLQVFLIMYKPVLQVLQLSSMYSLVDFYSFINPGQLVFIYGALHTQNHCKWNLYVNMKMFTLKFTCFEHVNFTRGKFPQCLAHYLVHNYEVYPRRTPTFEIFPKRHKQSWSNVAFK